MSTYEQDLEKVQAQAAKLYSSIRDCLQDYTKKFNAAQLTDFMNADREWCTQHSAASWIFAPETSVKLLVARQEYWELWCREHYPNVAEKLWPTPKLPRLPRGKLIEFADD